MEDTLVFIAIDFVDGGYGVVQVVSRHLGRSVKRRATSFKPLPHAIIFCNILEKARNPYILYTAHIATPHDGQSFPLPTLHLMLVTPSIPGRWLLSDGYAYVYSLTATGKWTRTPHLSICRA